MQNYWGTDTIHRTWIGRLISCYITSLASIFSDPPHVQHWLLAVWISRMKAPLLTDMHVTSYATHTRRREAGHTIRQWIGRKCMSISDLFNSYCPWTCNPVQCGMYGMCSAHQTPAQLYQPAWGYHGLSFHYPTLNHLQMLWRVPGLCPSWRQWGCAPTVAVYLQEEWAVEREDNWLVDAGSRYTVSIVLYNCADPEPDLKCWTHTWNSFPSGKTLPLPTSWTNPTAIKFIQHYLIRDMYRISTL